MWYILYFILNPAATNQIDGIANFVFPNQRKVKVLVRQAALPRLEEGKTIDQVKNLFCIRRVEEAKRKGDCLSSSTAST